MNKSLIKELIGKQSEIFGGLLPFLHTHTHTQASGS